MTTSSSLEDIKAELITTYHDFYVSDTNDGLFLSRGHDLTFGIRGDAVATYKLVHDWPWHAGWRLTHDEGGRSLCRDTTARERVPISDMVDLSEAAERMDSVGDMLDAGRSQPGSVPITSMTDFVCQFDMQMQSIEKLEIIQAALHQFESRAEFRVQGQHRNVLPYVPSISRKKSKITLPAHALREMWRRRGG